MLLAEEQAEIVAGAKMDHVVPAAEGEEVRTRTRMRQKMLLLQKLLRRDKLEHSAQKLKEGQSRTHQTAYASPLRSEDLLLGKTSWQPP